MPLTKKIPDNELPPYASFRHQKALTKLRNRLACCFQAESRTLFPIQQPFLITEVKNQGTNDLRAKEGLRKQARGNAIERLGKNVIGFRMALLHESIFLFACFGDGCDFAPDSSIIRQGYDNFNV
jgi:hypothetical protein